MRNWRKAVAQQQAIKMKTTINGKEDLSNYFNIDKAKDILGIKANQNIINWIKSGKIKNVKNVSYGNAKYKYFILKKEIYNLLDNFIKTGKYFL